MQKLISTLLLLFFISSVSAATAPLPGSQQGTYYFPGGTLTTGEHAIIFDDKGKGHELNAPTVTDEDIAKRRASMKDGAALSDDEISQRILSDLPPPVILGQPSIIKENTSRVEFPILEHWKYCQSRAFPIWNGAYYDCDTLQNTTHQHWQDSWTEMDPYPEFYRILRMFGPYQCVQYHNPAKCGGNPNVCCLARSHYNLTDRQYVDGNWNGDDYEYSIHNVEADLYSNNECSNPECVPVNPEFYTNAHAYGGKVASQSAESDDKYDMKDFMTGQNHIAMIDQLFSIDEPQGENPDSINNKVDYFHRFFWNNQETRFSDVPALMDEILFYFDDDDQYLGEWGLIQGGQFCHGQVGSHGHCDSGTDYYEWVNGFNYYLDDYTFFETGTLTDQQIKDEIDAGRPVSLRIGWDAGGGQAALIVGYNDSPLTWFIYDPINQLQAYSDAWLDTYPHKSWTGFFQEVITYDLDFELSSITTNPASPVEGETVSVNATVINHDNASFTNVPVSFSVDGERKQTKYVNLSRLGSNKTTFTWKASVGQHTLTVKVDPDDAYDESSENNNEASIDLDIPIPLRVLIIPYNWQGSYADFRAQAAIRGQKILSGLPLQSCPNQYVLIISNETDYGSDWDGFTCYDEDMIPPKCHEQGSYFNPGTLSMLSKCGEELTRAHADIYDYIVGITDRDISTQRVSSLPPNGSNCIDAVRGFSNGRGKQKAIVAETTLVSTPSHELGHLFGLADEYCDCSGTPYSDFCGPTAPTNPLQTQLGCQAGDGNGCCSDYNNSVSHPYSTACGWCLGNFDRFGIDTGNDSILDDGNRTMMSNLIIRNHFDQNEYSHLQGNPRLQCSNRGARYRDEFLGTLFVVDMDINQNGSVYVNTLNTTFGRLPNSEYDPGEYTLEVLAASQGVLYSENFGLPPFLFSDPPTPTDQNSFHTEFPYDPQMRSVRLKRNATTIFASPIDVFCDFDLVCEGSENYLVCPSDCGNSSGDGMCNAEMNGACDPDCVLDADPDCCVVPVDSMVIYKNTTLCEGHYVLPTGISISAGQISLRGKGTVLEGSAAANGIFLTGRQNVLIEGIRLQNYSKGIFVASGGNVTLRNVTTNGTSIGVLCQGSSWFTVADSSINNTRPINPPSSNGIGVYLSGCHRATLERNQLINNRKGILLDYADWGTIREHEIRSSSTAGIEMQGADYSLVERNSISQCSSAILASYGSNNTFVSNRFVQQSSNGIRLYAEGGGIVAYNNFTGNGLGLEFFADGNHHLVFGNRFDNNVWGYFSNTRLNNTRFWNNTFQGNNYVFRVFGGPFENVTIFGNRFLQSGHAVEEGPGVTVFWNLSGLGNYWDDFEQNQGYPDYYDISGDGFGVDWHPNTNAPPRIDWYSPNASILQLQVGDRIFFHQQSSDPDGDEMLFFWALNGHYRANASSWNYTASNQGQFPVNFTVSDRRGNATVGWLLNVTRADSGSPVFRKIQAYAIALPED
ncbi:MAG: NosD domain-containing protein [Nanoarchaeota archaeon]